MDKKRKEKKVLILKLVKQILTKQPDNALEFHQIIVFADYFRANLPPCRCMSP